jgi:sugar phosphate isomerase/epimerase
MKISVITNGISSDYEQACRIMNDTGVLYAEIQHHNGRPIENTDIEETMKIGALSARYGITPVCITTHAFAGIPLGNISLMDERYEEEFGLLKKGVTFAKILGVDKVRTMCFAKQPVLFGSHGAAEWISGGNRAWGKLVELFRPIARLAEEEAIDILIENGFNGMVSSTKLFIRLHEDLGSSRVKFLWDPVNALYYQEIPTIELYQNIRGLCKHIHIKDAHINTIESSVDICPIGKGDMAPYLQNLAQVLRRTNYDGCVSLENVYRPDGGDFIDGYLQDIVTLKEIFA